MVGLFGSPCALNTRPTRPFGQEPRSDQINALLLASQSDQAKIARRFIAMLRISVPFNKAEVWV